MVSTSLQIRFNCHLIHHRHHVKLGEGTETQGDPYEDNNRWMLRKTYDCRDQDMPRTQENQALRMIGTFSIRAPNNQRLANNGK